MNATAHPTVIEAPDGQPVITVTREFDAAPEAVFRAWTDPDLVTQWLGPDDLTMTVDRWDARSGGDYRYVHAGRDGQQFAFRGTFHTVRANELLVQTFEFEGVPDEVSLDVLHLVALDDGRTQARIRSTFSSVAARDAMIDSGMERGLRQGFDKLDRVLGAGAQIQ